MWHDKQKNLIALNKKCPADFGLGSCFEEYVNKKQNNKVPKNISFVKQKYEDHQDYSLQDRPDWNAKITEKYLKEQQQKNRYKDKTQIKASHIE